jgi:PAS domain S-box-containing protein
MTDHGLATAVVDAEGAVVAWSAQARSLLGWSSAEVVGQPAARLLAATLPREARKAAERLEPWDGEVAARHRDGRRLELWLRAHPVDDAGGRVLWFLAGFPAGADPGEPGGREVARMMLDWAFVHCPLELTLLDMDLRYVRLNSAALRRLGWGAEAEGLGQRLTDMAGTPDMEAVVARAREVLRTAEAVLHEGFGKGPGELHEHAWEITLSPAKDPAERVRGVLMVRRDVTRRHLARQRLELVQEAARIGSTLDMTRTAEEFVDVIVPRFADDALIDLLDPVLCGDEPTPGPIAGTAPLRRIAGGSVLRDSPESLIKPGQVPSYAGHAAVANSLATGRAALYPSAQRTVTRFAAQDLALAALSRRYGFHSVMMVPVCVRGATLGITIFVRDRRPDLFEADDLVLAEEITARAAICIDNARRYARERDTAITLQRSLLGGGLHKQPAVDTASRYLPAGSHDAVGGDWYDVIKLSGGRVGLVVGDVVGHGMHAAASMCRLRTAVRTIADADPEPAELLTSLEDVVTRHVADDSVPQGADTTSDFGATCLYAVYDPVTRGCSLARAGHPLPAVVAPEGRAYLLDLPAGPPLGLDGLPYEAAELELPDGTLLVFYTDGLIESRERDIEAGLNEMLRVLTEVHRSAHSSSGTPPSLETVCDAVLEALVPDQPADDVALLIARTHALAADRVVSWQLPAEPAVVADARARAGRQLAVWGLEELTFTTELVVSELVTNAIRHARGPIQLRLILDDVLICEVSDRSSTAPHPRRPNHTDEGGRGLLLVAQLTELWGTRQTQAGKTIWAEQLLPTG